MAALDILVLVCSIWYTGCSMYQLNVLQRQYISFTMYHDRPPLFLSFPFWLVIALPKYTLDTLERVQRTWFYHLLGSVVGIQYLMGLLASALWVRRIRELRCMIDEGTYYDHFPDPGEGADYENEDDFELDVLDETVPAMNGAVLVLGFHVMLGLVVVGILISQYIANLGTIKVT